MHISHVIISQLSSGFWSRADASAMDIKHSPHEIDLKQRRRDDDEAEHKWPQLHVAVVVSDCIPVIQQVTTTDRRHHQHLIVVLTHSAKHLLNEQTRNNTRTSSTVHTSYNLTGSHSLSDTESWWGLNPIWLDGWLS